MSLLTIVMPTILGREEELERTIEAYERLTPAKIEWIVEHDHPTCAAAWTAGAEKATGEMLHLGNDDLEPETTGWFIAAAHCLRAGNVPLGWVTEDALGRFGRDFTRVPMCMREWWRPLPDLHYYSDNLFGDWMRQAGHPPTIAEGFDFYHRRSMVGRDESRPRVERDYAVYLANVGLRP